MQHIIRRRSGLSNNLAAPVVLSVRVIDVEGKLFAPGICPHVNPGRGSGTFPINRSNGLASTISTEAFPLSISLIASKIIDLFTIRLSCIWELYPLFGLGATKAPVSVGYPKLFHKGSPPSSNSTFLWPMASRCHKTLQELRNPFESYTII
ncbi:hypothetical protein AX774_g2114 [Zancudomyces culisetae]|uniref:Uncharacterized protein n=1 Tax=Zancudomyces culisetae TaxID=1213189 RepID=A0A1R1PTR8_ZANCU|nr:hypothetical protein AX774_g2114 [Zancudomyces culisetae]|eukprot:OMH84358.1 hypothetical protein AX774_g2114 [Zancudomyces culisetae]